AARLSAPVPVRCRGQRLAALPPRVRRRPFTLCAVVFDATPADARRTPPGDNARRSVRAAQARDARPLVGRGMPGPATAAAWELPMVNRRAPAPRHRHASERDATCGHAGPRDSP